MKPYDLPDARGHFGPYGGLFVAETLMHALDGAARRLRALAQRSGFIAELDDELEHVRRPAEPGLSRPALVRRSSAARRSG